MSHTAVPEGASPTSAEHIRVLLKNARFCLPDAYVPEVIVAYGYVERLAARIHGGYPRGAEPAHVFDPRAFLPVPEACHG
ncbi:Uncharacterised protein [Bordetella ansorpii]|uniref:Uncharacterized protein n=1 Tax=Bordetella ansorpii TaxID=288768 RepID=A0A157KBV4_9BORD|nr:hypothetical protein [Bordetella ansorpii]SAH81912.1 Uncharacterised protein [Bordetella ansorpii]